MKPINKKNTILQEKKEEVLLLSSGSSEASQPSSPVYAKRTLPEVVNHEPFFGTQPPMLDVEIDIQIGKTSKSSDSDKASSLELNSPTPPANPTAQFPAVSLSREQTIEHLRKENQSLREENTQLQTKLSVSEELVREYNYLYPDLHRLAEQNQVLTEKNQVLAEQISKLQEENQQLKKQQIEQNHSANNQHAANLLFEPPAKRQRREASETTNVFENYIPTCPLNSDEEISPPSSLPSPS